MKIIAINCSPKKGRSTYQALQKALEGVRAVSTEITTEIYELGTKHINPCIDCGRCASTFGCSQDDDFQSFIDLLDDTEIAGLIIGTPVYMGSMTSQCKAFIDRTVTFRRNGFRFRDMLGGVISTGGSRNGGQELTIQSIHAAMHIHDMLPVSDGNETAHFGGTVWAPKGKDTLVDPVGLTTCFNLGKRMATLASKLHS